MSQHAITPESLFELRWVSDPQLSPDGKQLAYVEHWVEQIEKDGKTRQAYRSAVYLSSAPDAAPRRLTYSAHGSDSAPRWAPDGQSLAFLSTRDDDKAQLFVLSLAGGEAQPVTRTATLSEGVIEYDWHPSGTMFCFVSQGHRTEQERKDAERNDEKVYENRLPFKADGTGLLEATRPQLYRINRDGGDCVRLTEHGRRITSPVWSPDGHLIAFNSQSETTPEVAWIGDIFVVGADGSGLRQLTESRGPASNPAWSPDSTALAYLGHERSHGAATALRVWRVGREGGTPRCLTPDFAGHAGQIASGDAHLGTSSLRPVWDASGTLTFEALVQGRAGLYRVPANGGKVEQINTSGLSITGWSQRGATLAFGGETNTRAAEIYSSHDGHAVTRRSHAADDFFSRYRVAPPEHVRFAGVDGWEIEGWVIKPRGVEHGGRHPLIVYVHGGPHLAYGNAFIHEFQVLAAAGFGVFFTNPRGSGSYGEDFANAVRHHYGENDFGDVMRAADTAASWEWVDSERMGIMGGSYGGFMTNWVITHTDRFAAACTQRSISNLFSFAGTSDIGPEFAQDEWNALPWTDEELLLQKSPLRYVRNIKTPTLILHQEQDHRCPIEQAEQLYTALVMLGVPAKFVRFPDECHELPRSGQPQRRVNRMGHIVDWFTRYLRPNPPS